MVNMPAAVRWASPGGLSKGGCAMITAKVIAEAKPKGTGEPTDQLPAPHHQPDERDERRRPKPKMGRRPPHQAVSRHQQNQRGSKLRGVQRTERRPDQIVAALPGEKIR